jgi:hypothetical protein
MRPEPRQHLPCYSDAPLALLETGGNCGLLSAWGVLRHFRKRTNSAKLIKRCGYTRRYGVFTIGLACALAEAGLRVSFHTQLDPDPKPLERRLYRRAHRLGIPILPAADILTLVAASRRGELPIVFYDTKDGVGHFSPLIGARGRKLLLPYGEDGGLRVNEFERAWSAPGICRQAVVTKAA